MGLRHDQPPPRPHRYQAGAVSAEFVAILLLAAALVAAVIALALPTTVGDAGEVAIDCLYADGTACDVGPGGPGGPDDDGGGGDDDSDEPDRGPAPPTDRVVTDESSDDERAEGDDAVGNPELDELYHELGQYHQYLWEAFGRDSWDGDGGPLNGEVNASVPNAQWSPSTGTMSYAADWVALDVTAHEVTHGMIQDEAGLVYEGQSGALNEAIADMFASNVDGNWEIGEDTPAGTLRDMSDPAAHGQPAHVDDWVDTTRDHGGVHTNSGIPNHAYFLMVEANGRDVSEQVLYRALTEHLESDATFEDFRTAMLDSAEELYGDGPERDAIDEAFAEVGLDGTWSP